MPQQAKPKVRYRIVPEKTATIVVDMQNQFVKVGAPVEVPDARAMVPRLNALLDASRRCGIPVIHVQHILRGDGSDAGRLADMHPRLREARCTVEGSELVEIYAEVDVRPGDIFVRKPRYSAFYGSDLDVVLRSKGIDTVIIAGTVTNVCCLSTALDAFSRDYKLVFLSDGNATHEWADMGWGPVPAEEAQRVALTVLATCFGQVASIGEIVEEMRTASMYRRIPNERGIQR